jgi:hypothetical protein
MPNLVRAVVVDPSVAETINECEPIALINRIAPARESPLNPN